MDLTLIIRGVIMILAGIITAFVVPLLKNKLSVQQMDILYTLVNSGVHAAEQLFYSDQGQEKYNFVLNYLRERGYNVDDEALQGDFKVMIEAAVKELRIEDGYRTVEKKEQ